MSVPGRMRGRFDGKAAIIGFRSILNTSLKNCFSGIHSVFKTMFPDDIGIDRQWMRYLTALVIFDVLSTTMLLWGGAGAGSSSEANPLMGYIVHRPFLHLAVKLLFVLFTIIVANIMEHNYEGIGTRIVQAACVPYMIVFTVNFFWTLYSIKLFYVMHGIGI
jgi:hypothetical protein